MASRFLPENQAQLRPRKGHDMKWSCDIHGEPIAFNCKKHDVPICQRCANKDHGQKPCELDDIEDVIFERRRQLDDKQHEIEKTKQQLKTLDSKLESNATYTSNHLETVNEEVKSAHKERSKSVKNKEERKIRLINEEADEEIRIINEKRDGRIKACNAEIEKEQLIIEESQAKFISETKAIRDVVSKQIKDLTNKNQHAISTMDNIDAKIKRIKQDKTLVNEAPQVLASLDDNSSLNFHQDVMDCLDRIQREVQKMKFVEGEVGGEHYGRIDGYIGRWELVKSIHIPSSVTSPRMCGLISDNEICVGDGRNRAAYVTNISTEHTHNVMEGHRSMYISSCAPIDSNVILCVNQSRFGCTGDSLDGYITLYDRKWKVIRDITIPRNDNSTVKVYIDIDRDGMILAAPYDQSNIYVINPDDGKIVDTITMQGKVVRGEIHALSSGDILVQIGDSGFTLISRSGEEKVVIRSDEGRVSRCCVDKLTDTLYITYWDKERSIYSVDQVSCNGVIQARRIVEYEKSDRSNTNPLYTGPCLVIPSGNIVACSGDKVCVYKKKFIV